MLEVNKNMACLLYIQRNRHNTKRFRVYIIVKQSDVSKMCQTLCNETYVSFPWFHFLPFVTLMCLACCKGLQREVSLSHPCCLLPFTLTHTYYTKLYTHYHDFPHCTSFYWSTWIHTPSAKGYKTTLLRKNMRACGFTDICGNINVP